MSGRKRNRASTGEARTRLEDVAAEAGVSPATVSRCLNKPELVSAEVRDRVAAAVERLGYVPDGAARALASQKTRTIGAVVPTIDHAIFAQTIGAFQKRLAASGYTLLLGTMEYDPEAEVRQVRAFLEKGVEGVMLVGETRPSQLYDMLRARRVPFITTWLYRENADYPCCGFDHVDTMRRVVAELVRLKHRRIGIITGITNLNDRVAARLAGIKHGFRDHGIPFDPTLVVECRYSVEEGRCAARALLEKEDPPTAIICGNDVLALGVLFEATDLGWKVPDDLSILGFGDYELAGQIKPQLSTVYTPKTEIGRLSAEYLISRIEKQPVQDRIRLETEIRLRETTAEARSTTRPAIVRGGELARPRSRA